MEKKLIIDQENLDKNFIKEELIDEDYSYTADGVKTYLRDIGKIPLLNKTTLHSISEKIAQSKKLSIKTISLIPFVHEKLIIIGEKIEKEETSTLKETIQFSEYDEENLPRLEEETEAFLKAINIIKKKKNISKTIQSIGFLISLFKQQPKK